MRVSPSKALRYALDIARGMNYLHECKPDAIIHYDLKPKNILLDTRRSDPRKYHYSCVPCPEFRKGTCRQGNACEYAHGIFECWLYPAQYQTRLCKDETGCSRRVCFFAHKPEELRPLYASTGSAVPSPRSFSNGAPSLDMTSMSMLGHGSPLLMPPTSTPSDSIVLLGQLQMPLLHHLAGANPKSLWDISSNTMSTTRISNEGFHFQTNLNQIQGFAGDR